MDFSEVRAHLAQECQFPVEHEELVERVGDVHLDCPTGEPETVGTVLRRAGTASYRSADEVHTALLGAVGDDYVGRKHYDDRSGARSIPDDRRAVSV